MIALALRGKKIGFDKVIKMIDEMIATLQIEQADDDHKKEYCSVQLDMTEDKKKVLETAVSDREVAIENAKEGIAKLTEEIAALKAGITELDKMVMEATEQRKVENGDFKEKMASNTAAKELLNFAKNRLNKFYNPKLYKAPPPADVSEEDRLYAAQGGVVTTAAPGGIAGTGITVFAQVSMHSDQDAAPAPPPETWGAYTSKSKENTGVMAMIDLLVKDLDKEMTEAETEEKDSQADYEQLMSDSAAKRTADSQAVDEKSAAKADATAALESHTDAKEDATKEAMLNAKFIASLHGECDFLLQYFDARQAARAGEVDSLGRAKAVLSGADFSLVQVGRSRTSS